MKAHLILLIGLVLISPAFLGACALVHACRDGLCR